MAKEKTERINELFDELVPASGKASNLAGELVRACSRIGYRFLNDGDILNVDYGRETTNAAGRFLMTYGNETIRKMVEGMWGWCGLDSTYERLVDELCEAVADYVDSTPALREIETVDMWSLRTDEDVDDTEDEDYYEDEEEDD